MPFNPSFSEDKPDFPLLVPATDRSVAYTPGINLHMNRPVLLQAFLIDFCKLLIFFFPSKSLFKRAYISAILLYMLSEKQKKYFNFFEGAEGVVFVPEA